MYSLREVENKVNQLDSMKFIDEDGKEKISGRELAKALGYTDWRNFKQAVNRANDQIKASGKADSCLIGEVNKQTKISTGKGPDGKERFQDREITDYHLTRRQAINVANNCDTKKPEVALVQQYLYETSEIGERATNIYNKIKDKIYIDNRSNLGNQNREFARVCLNHGTKQNELGIIHDACDNAMYGMGTKEIKDTFGKSNRPKADFIGAEMCGIEYTAKQISCGAIEKENAYGLDECKNIAVDIHTDLSNYVYTKTGKTPVELITGEDVKKVERRYNKQIEEQLKALEHEF